MLRVLAGEALTPPPIWLMRQAGRYLPEYRAVRAKAGGFLDLCYAPELAAEVTLQPIRRYGFDAAILFADILIVPDALGQGVRFVEGEGPRLDAIRSEAELARLSASATRPKFARIFETVRQGSAGSPARDGADRVLRRAVDGGDLHGGRAGQCRPGASAIVGLSRSEQGFQRLIDLLADVSVEYLSGQVEAGADVLQIFDSWAGSLADDQFRRWVIAPTARMVAQLKQRHPAVPVIGFPRGAGLQAKTYAAETGVDGVSCDTSMPLEFIAGELSPHTVVQGNLDPLLLVTGGAALERRVAETLAALSHRPFVFNLGHGIVPETPPENVARLVELVRAG